MDLGPHAYEQNPLECQLVEIQGVVGKLEPSPDTKARQPDTEPVDVNGERGRVVGWSGAEGKYIVETFDGLILGVPEGNLQEFAPPDPEDGGFDLVWPSSPSLYDAFASDLAAALGRKGYCLIQMFNDQRKQQSALEAAHRMPEWQLPIKELEVAYMGYDNSTKYATLPADDMREYPSHPLLQLDRVITNLGILLEPLAPSALGFTIDGRMNGYVRVPLASAEEGEKLRPPSLSEEEVLNQDKVHGHVNFMDHRKLSLMYFVANDGGSLELYPAPAAGPDVSKRVRLPLSRNKLLVFVSDMMSYSYRPAGEQHLLLQSWLLKKPFTSDPSKKEVVTLPPLMQEERVHIKALQLRVPGGGFSTASAWTMWSVATDGAVKIPYRRLDIDVYYDADTDGASGKLYTCHAACISDTFMFFFDNDYFKIPPDEAQRMGVGQRNLCEVGMEVLHEAGHTKDTLKNFYCGVYVGEKNTDFKFMTPWIMQLEGSSGNMSPCFHSGYNPGITCTRLSYIYGMRGPCFDVDTACSSALVAMGDANRTLRARLGGQRRPGVTCDLKNVMVMGMDLVDGIGSIQGYCFAHMVSTFGRSMTFDKTANGFVRGDCAGGMLLTRSDSDEDSQSMTAMVLGTNVNQDGRSASLSAPNGPAQQMCIKNSMFESGLKPSEINVGECHGTGTALGDPIEVSAIRMVMLDRDTPIILTTAKSNFGHTEAAAGISGIAKCTTCLLSACGASNLHLKELNPHIEFEKFPALFVTEDTDSGREVGISGVSSFGVGGTNARGDIWARALFGQRRTTEVFPYKRWRLQNVRHARIEQYGTPGPGPEDKLFLAGTWSGWSRLEEMEPALGDGEWTATVVIGWTRRETFRIVLNEDRNQCIYPGPGAAAEVLGPDWQGEGKGWLLDGVADGAEAGTEYRVTFAWTFSYDHGERKTMTWRRTGAKWPLEVKGTYEHSYYIVGSFNTWSFQKMEREGEGECSTYTVKVRIGSRGHEEFQIVRDKDWKQVIHPAINKPTKTNVPIRGPDDDGHKKNWRIRGRVGDHSVVSLSISSQRTAAIVLSVVSPVWGTKTWSSRDNNNWLDYFVAGTWDNWEQCHDMCRHPERAGVYTLTLTFASSGVQEFQILANRDWGMAIYPDKHMADVGEALACGPDKLAAGRNWCIAGRACHEYEIVFDTTQADKRSMVSWSELSMGELTYPDEQANQLAAAYD